MLVETSAWPKAIYNIGLTKERHGDFSTAILYFEKVIESHPNDKEPSADIREAYRNYSYYSAGQISLCYEHMGDFRRALHWARAAKSTYPYRTWCGTCARQAAFQTNKRIAYLSTRVAGPYVLTTLLLVGGVVVIWRRSGKGTASS